MYAPKVSIRRVVAIGLTAGLATLAVHGDSGAQPAPPPAPAPAPQPDYARAKQLYDSATTAFDKGQWADAERDFGAAYEITKDPVLFFKIGAAYEKAGSCEIALSYYTRYLREARPAQSFVDLTKERVEACAGDWKVVLAAAGMPAPEVGSGSGSATGSGSASASASGSASASASASGSESGSGSGSGSGSDVALTGLGSGVDTKPHTRDLPWVMVGGALAFATAGAVLAYSATSSEQDIKDLYVGVDGKTPVFDEKTKQRYQDLLDEGHRYQYLSWGAFGVAAGFGIAATLIFIHDHVVEERRVLVTPTATPSSAGAALTVRF